VAPLLIDLVRELEGAPPAGGGLFRRWGMRFWEELMGACVCARTVMMLVLVEVEVRPALQTYVGVSVVADISFIASMKSPVIHSVHFGANNENSFYFYETLICTYQASGQKITF